MSGAVELIETRSDMAMVVARSMPNRPGIAAELFLSLGKGGFNIEMISESAVEGKLADIAFAIDEQKVSQVEEYLKSSKTLPVKDFSIEKNLGILTIFGKNLSAQPGIAGKVFSLLAQEAINIKMISTSLSSISVLIKSEYLAPAKNLMSKEFGVNA